MAELNCVEFARQTLALSNPNLPVTLPRHTVSQLLDEVMRPDLQAEIESLRKQLNIVTDERRMGQFIVRWNLSGASATLAIVLHDHYPHPVSRQLLLHALDRGAGKADDLFITNRIDRLRRRICDLKPSSSTRGNSPCQDDIAQVYNFGYRLTPAGFAKIHSSFEPAV